jgi:putative toxin-antitoxin system antitoxin component (TIGR02293 family)
VLSGHESDRSYRIARVLRRAFEVYGVEDSVLEWFRKPQPFLEYHAPFELLGSDAGTQVVEQELGRIEYGDFS